MHRKKIIFIYFILISIVYSLNIHSAVDFNIPKISSNFVNKFYPQSGSVHPGQPLYLTKYLPKNFQKAQILAKVNIPEFNELNIASFSGYFTIDPAYNSNLFFWYFPAKVDTAKAPVLLWLSGGPGMPLALSLFNENGPVYINTDGKFTPRKYSWNNDHHLIYVDSPGGTGYSFTDAYMNNSTIIGQHLLKFMQQFYQLFPNLQSHEFYITGESFAGKFIPALGYAILNSNSVPKINLKGMAIGNGFCDPINQLVYGDFFYELGLVDDIGKIQIDNVQQKTIKCIQEGNYKCAFWSFAKFFGLHNKSLFRKLTGLSSFYNYIQGEPGNPVIPVESAQLEAFITLNSTRRGLHVGMNYFNNINNVTTVTQHLENDYMKSVADWISVLLSHYRIFMYNGQLDLIVPFVATENVLDKLNFSSSAEFSGAKRSIWKVDPYIAGYIKNAGNLTHILVRDAGHMVPEDQPKWALDIINHLTHNIKF